MLAGLGLKAPTATKTGTTIAGIVFKARFPVARRAPRAR